MRANSAVADPFGAALKGWRARRRMSQLDLALTAGVSARHLAFLETGRSKPSREMVVVLCDAMDVPLRERNALLSAAGFAALYAARPLHDNALAPVRAAYEMLLQKHEPYPAILLDRYWNLLQANRAARSMLGLPAKLEDINLVRMLACNPATPMLVANWLEVAHGFVDRLRLETAVAGGDPMLDHLISLLLTDPVFADGKSTGQTSSGPFIGARIRTAGGEVKLFSTIAEFGTVEDITVRDLRIELFFPADDDSRAVLMALDAGGA